MPIINSEAHVLPEPNIQDEALRHVTRGENLHVNCTVEVDSSMRYVFNWTQKPPKVYNMLLSASYCEKLCRRKRDTLFKL